LRILCVDDDALVLAVTADLLRSLGHDVIEANGGNIAAEALRDPSIEALVTDIHMPGGPDGVQLADYAQRVRPGLRVVYFSGLPHSLPAGVNGAVLRKPCSLGELQNALLA
jgi:CheY-like chemotaxis protein